MALDHKKDVFINCPFDIDGAYQKLEDAIIFTIIDCGFKPRSAKESTASGNRLDKIQKIIEECQFAIHDISRTELDSEHQLPRFNMPLELGIFLGARRYGGKKHKIKECLIFDREQHRYEKFISDLKGHDIQCHYDQSQKVISPIRNFLAEVAKNEKISSANTTYKKYLIFVDWLENYCKENDSCRKELSFGEFSQHIYDFLDLTGK